LALTPRIGLPLHLAARIERWRGAHGARVVDWLEATGELEALVSLAAYAFERPLDTFPELVEEGPCFAATALAHPLIPERQRVANDLTLDGSTRLLVVSGSNMSGKSTLLRAVGVNTVLALAGAPACATRLTLSPMSVGATMRIHDSLRAGESRFYAEIRRVRSLMDLSGGARPVLFLLDELLQGTNSHDRRIAAEAVLRGFLDRGAAGLISTHDLALAEIADALAPRAVNVHFQDELTAEGLRFDYRLRPGVVTRSNALALMRSIGLEV
jgi:DNA mismatch repair ATPase MutS